MDRMICFSLEGFVFSFYLNLFATEVDQEPMLNTGRREIVDELDFMGWDQASDGFEFEN